MPFQHKNLAEGSWQNFTLLEQLGNIGSEISRALLWRKKDEKIFYKAIERALELLDFTMRDSRWRKRLKEIARLREILCDTVFGGSNYNSSLEDIDRYLFYFAVASRMRVK